MAPLGLLTVVGVSILLLDKASGDAPTISYTAKLGEENACLTEINAARAIVGFSELTAPTAGDSTKRLPGSTSDTSATANDWLPLCKTLIPEEAAKSPSGDSSQASKFGSGTYAFAALKSNPPDCLDVVDGWIAAYKNFNGLPPPNNDSTKIYENRDNVSFVAMYNPSPGATADCRVVTCTQKTTASGGTDMASTAADQSKFGYALVCMTTPDVLKKGSDTAPFTAKQWGKIVSVLSGSASTVLPSLLGLTATVLAMGVVLL